MTKRATSTTNSKIWLILIFLLIADITSTSAQEKYYKISNVSLKLNDKLIDLKDRQHEHKVEYLDTIVASDKYTIIFKGSGYYSLFDFEGFAYHQVALIDHEYNLIYHKNMAKDQPKSFKKKGRYSFNKYHDIKIRETGKTKIINSRLCHEFEINHGYNYYFIDKSLPFINYMNFPDEFPGFVTSFKTPFDNAEVVMKLEEINYQDKYFKYINEFEKEHKYVQNLFDQNMDQNVEIPQQVKNFVLSEYIYVDSPYKFSRDIVKARQNKLKSRAKSFDNSGFSLVYFDREGNAILADSISKTSSNNNDIKRIYGHDGRTISEYCVNETLNEIEIKNSYSKDVFNINTLKRTKPFTLNNKLDSVFAKTDYFYSGIVLDSFTEINLEELTSKTTSIEYNKFGLPSAVIKDHRRTELNYLFREGKLIDTLYIIIGVGGDLTEKTFREVHLDKNGIVTREKKTGRSKSDTKFLYSYFNEETKIDLQEVKDEIRYQYIKGFLTNEPINSHKFFRHNYQKSDKSGRATEWYPEISVESIEFFFEDQEFKYYKAHYNEVLNSVKTQQINPYRPSISDTEIITEKKINTRFLLIKRDKKTDKWIINI